MQSPVTEYIQAANELLNAAATQYAAGVYGSGLTCRLIRDAGLANFTWLAGASGFRESKAFHSQANVVQAAPGRTLFGGQLNIDDVVAQTSGFGAFRLLSGEVPGLESLPLRRRSARSELNRVVILSRKPKRRHPLVMLKKAAGASVYAKG